MELKSEKAFRIADLILRYQEETISEEEMEELRLWLKKSTEHQQQFENLNDRDYIRRKRELDLSINPAAAYTAFSERIARERPWSYRKLRGLAAVAAVCLIAIGIYWCWLREDRNGTLVPQVSTSVIPAGSSKAVLTLANGEQIHLCGDTATSIKQQDGSVAKASSASLVYQNIPSLPEELLYNSLSIPRKGEFTLVLSDGTKIWLNSESEVEYPIVFPSGERRIRLQGEAYFQVASDKSSPFIIEMGKVQVQVLGTSFNIKAYKNEADVITTLFTGKVDVASLADTTGKVVLSPGKQAGWNPQTGNLSVSEANLDNVIAWKEGMFVFNKENIEVVTRQIERWYGVKFIYETGAKKDYTFNGYFSKDEALKSILEAFTFTGGPEFKIEGNVVYVRNKS